MTTALANVEYRPREIDTEKLGAIFVKSGFFQDTRDAAQAIVKILAGAELGFGPLASMQGVYIVKGRVTLSANLVGAAIQRSGKYGYEVVELTNEKCLLRFYTMPNVIGATPRRTFESAFSMEDARLAGIAGDTYKKFPRNMLFSRALTNGARWFCPEVFNGPIYTPDELGAEVDSEGVVIEELPGSQPFFPTRERDVEDQPRNDADPTVERALELWIEACAWAGKHGIAHKELPAGAPVSQIEKWTAALNAKIAEKEDEAF